MKSLTWLAGAAVAGLGLVVGCSASNVDFDEQDDDGGGAAGGQGGMGGAGGADNPCEMDCSTLNAPDCHVAVCNTGQYPGEVNKCAVVPSEAGVECDDGQFCTVDDACDGEGVCQGGGQNDCGMDPAECEEIVCDEASESCTPEPIAAGEACTPDDLCEVGATCDASGNCSGTPKDCFFEPVPNECHVSECNPNTGMCEANPDPSKDGEACTDQNDLCTVNKTCDSAGNCTGGSPKDCSHLTQGCDIGVCDTSTGVCTTNTVMDGDPCDDLDGCTTGETCSNGTCGGGTPVTTCSGANTADGCCPSGCTVADDLDCAICTHGWDDGTLQGWTVSSTCSPQINWQPDTQRSDAGTHSLYYGDASTHDYDCSNGTHSGTATSKSISLQTGTPDVTFSVFIDTEGGTTFDQLGLWVMPADVQVWDRNDFTEGQNGDTNGQFIQQTVDLSAYAGQTIQLEFRFDTVDGIANSGEGVYIDSLTAQGYCP